MNRFGKIIYLGIRSEEYIAHILWLMPACQTTLKELAHPQELMMVARCDNINVAAFIQPFSLSRLDIDVDEPPLPNKDNYSEYPFDSFFYR